ncbi:MAG: WecB/TagA/CpsF family glycosyltransferase [Actinobacteria bacterium]|nr:WecB/TagA/CpsF family glycosyltransferase [Actinomycetota bacterium]
MLNPTDFFHIVSLNPEIFVLASENSIFKRAIETAQIQILDGIGVKIAGSILGVRVGDRLTGVEMMRELVKTAGELRLRMLLIGGRPGLANKISQCYQEKYPKSNFFGLEGFSDIKKQTESEKKRLFSIVADFKPHIVLTAFGSPDQELWFFRNKDLLKGKICLGVGQGFDLEGKIVVQAPPWIRKIGMEWLYRLMTQPWRWRRQLRLIRFITMVIREKLFNLI